MTSATAIESALRMAHTCVRRPYVVAALTLACLVTVASTMWLLGHVMASGQAFEVADWTFEADAIAAPRPLTLPTDLASVLPAEDGEFRLVTEVSLPERLAGRPLTFAFPRYDGRADLLVDGVPARMLDPECDRGYRSCGHARWAIEPHAPTVRLTLRVHHRWQHSARLVTVPRLSEDPHGDLWSRLTRTFNMATAAVAVTGLLLIASMYAVIFLLDTRRASHGWFAAPLAAASAYPAFELGLTTFFFPRAEAAVMALSLVAALTTSFKFTHTYLGLGAVPRAVLLPLGACAIVGLLAHEPFVATIWLAPFTVFSLATGVLYQLVTCVKTYRRTRSTDPLLFAASWTALCASTAVDFAAWLGLGEVLGGVRTASIGLCFFALFQLAVLMREYHGSLVKSDELNQELAARIDVLDAKRREVEALNAELRHQVAQRSDAIVNALSRLRVLDPAVDVFSPGEIIDARYRVVAPLGAGAMGAVFEVERLTDGRRFALKMLTRAGNHALLARFAREANLIARIFHPNVVGIVDVSIADAFFIVMELVGGRALSAHRGSFGRVAWAVPILQQVAEGLAAVHESGIVHRDLKPANILLEILPDGSPRPKIADFGISSLRHEPREAHHTSLRTLRVAAATVDAAHDTRDALTNTGSLLGTPAYMAPELVNGAHDALPRCDVYSFGVIAFEMLAGEMPFTQTQNLMRLLGPSSPTPSFRAQCPSLPTAIADVLDRCLSLAPEERPTARELADALRIAQAAVA
jgi:serine/threonine-protein kinase